MALLIQLDNLPIKDSLIICKELLQKLNDLNDVQNNSGVLSSEYICIDSEYMQEHLKNCKVCSQNFSTVFNIAKQKYPMLDSPIAKKLLELIQGTK